MNRAKLLLDAHQIAPNRHFSDADTDEEIRRQLVLAFFGPEPPVDIHSNDEIRLAFEAMVRNRASVEDGFQGKRKRHLRLLH